MAKTTNRPKDPVLEGARKRLRAIIVSSAISGSSLHLQRVAKAGLLVLDTLPSCPEARLLAEIIAKQVGGIYNLLHHIARVDKGLKNALMYFLRAVTRIQKEIEDFSDWTAVVKLAAFEETLQDISARIMAITMEEEAGGPSPTKLTSQNINGNNSTMSNLLGSTNSLLGPNTPSGTAGDSPSQSVAAVTFMALVLQLREVSAAMTHDTIPTDQPLDPSAIPTDTTSTTLHRSQTLDAEETHQPGLDLLKVSRQNGDLGCLSNAISHFRGSLLLCSSDSRLRLQATGNLAVALLTRYQQTGDYSSVMEAITLFYGMLKLCPSDYPGRATTLSNLASAILIRYERGGSLLDLSEATELYREALDLHPLGHPDRAASLGNLSNAILTRYKREGSLLDLSEATDLYRKALDLCPLGHPDRAASLGNLSNAILTRYQREGSLLDLSEATDLCREALDLHPLCHPARTTSLGNLSNAILTRYQREGSLLDLSEATELYREVLDLHPLGHPDRASSLNSLSNALFTRYEREGNLLDLSEATEHYREALDLRPPGHPGRASSLNNLSSTLFARYGREGILLDLSEATEHHREALELRPPGHPDRASSLLNLSNALLTRYEREGNLLDLSEATERYREALDLCPPGHLDRGSSLLNLSTALLTRYKREGSLLDLSEATEHYREALELRPPGHPGRASSLLSLSNALSARYEREGRLLDLSGAIEHNREALELRPPGHPDRASSLNNLSNALLIWYKRKGSLLDLSEATEHYREALELRPPGHPDRASSLLNLSNALLIRYQREGSLSDLSDATEHRREVLTLCPYGHPERTQSLSSLSRALVYTIDATHDTLHIHHHQALVQEIFEALREAVNLPNCPPLHRLRAALEWIDITRRLASNSMLDAYTAALDQLDIVLATRDTLENKHDQLISSEGLSRCRRLGIEAASYAVRQGHMAIAVELLERGRNLLFAQVGRYRVDVEELRKVDTKLADRFFSLSNLLDASVVSNRPTLEGRTAFEDPIERYRRVSSDWSQAVDDIRALEGFDGFLRSPKYETLRSAAAKGPVIVVIPDEGNSVALIISHEHAAPHHVGLPKAGTDKLEKLCSALEEAVNSDNGVVAERSVKKILRLLWDLVVGPITDALENELHVPLHSRIWWCPTSLFSSLPLHAAGRYASEDTTQHLPDRYVSSYTPTLHALMRAGSNLNYGVRKEEKMLIVAQPDTPGQLCLPDVQREAELVKKLVETQMACALYSSKEGTRAAVVDAMDRYSWLHLTCHGSQHFLNPFQSSFHLWDGNLTLHDIIQRGLPDAKFAFLAACHTATGDFKLLDEGLHLAAGLQFAGFKSVVGTIWEVADIDGPVIAEAFYEALQQEQPEEEGMDCSRAAYALSKAVKKLRDSGVPISRWMRFIHIGI